MNKLPVPCRVYIDNIYIWHVFHNGENHDTPFRGFPPRHSQPGAGPRQFSLQQTGALDQFLPPCGDSQTFQFFISLELYDITLYNHTNWLEI